MSKYWGLADDGFLFSAPVEKRFIKKYQDKWAATVSDFYFESEAIDVGHKLRPRLVLWGFLANREPNAITDNMMDDVAQIAVCVELIHKSSLLLDDFIDKDTSRHSAPSFYTVHGVERTIIFSLNILCKALALVNQVFSNYASLKSFYYKSMKEISKTLHEMTLGVLMELDLTKETACEFQRIREIMYYETSSLIRNSLLMGYYLAASETPPVEEIFCQIGKDIGFAFQVLNDLEAFFSPRLNDHKGSKNNDISRCRKNICIPTLMALVSQREQRKLLQIWSNPEDDTIYHLMIKYNVKEILLQEVQDILLKCEENILCNKHKFINPNWCPQFLAFIESVVTVFMQRIIN